MTRAKRQFAGDPYHSPEACGLEILETFERPDVSYEFDMLVFWRDLKSKKIYCLSDSGCSCPSPYENVRSMEDLTLCPDRKTAIREFDSWGNGNTSDLMKIEAMFQ